MVTRRGHVESDPSENGVIESSLTITDRMDLLSPVTESATRNIMNQVLLFHLTPLVLASYIPR